MQILLSVPDKNLVDVLCSGIESGVNCWAESYDVYGTRAQFEEARAMAAKFGDSKSRYWNYCLPLTGGRILIRERDRSEKGRVLYVTKSKLRKAVGLMASEHANWGRKFLSEVLDPSSGDARTGDVLIQLAVFGELVYG